MQKRRKRFSISRTQKGQKGAERAERAERAEMLFPIRVRAPRCYSPCCYAPCCYTARQPPAAVVLPLEPILPELWRLSQSASSQLSRRSSRKHSVKGKIKHLYGVFTLRRCSYMARLKNDCRRLKMPNRAYRDFGARVVEARRGMLCR